MDVSGSLAYFGMIASPGGGTRPSLESSSAAGSEHVRVLGGEDSQDDIGEATLPANHLGNANAIEVPGRILYDARQGSGSSSSLLVSSNGKGCGDEETALWQALMEFVIDKAHRQVAGAEEVERPRAPAQPSDPLRDPDVAVTRAFALLGVNSTGSSAILMRQGMDGRIETAFDMTGREAGLWSNDALLRVEAGAGGIATRTPPTLSNSSAEPAAGVGNDSVQDTYRTPVCSVDVSGVVSSVVSEGMDADSQGQRAGKGASGIVDPSGGDRSLSEAFGARDPLGEAQGDVPAQSLFWDGEEEEEQLRDYYSSVTTDLVVGVNDASAEVEGEEDPFSWAARPVPLHSGLIGGNQHECATGTEKGASASLPASVAYDDDDDGYGYAYMYGLGKEEDEDCDAAQDLHRSIDADDEIPLLGTQQYLSQPLPSAAAAPLVRPLPVERLVLHANRYPGVAMMLNPEYAGNLLDHHALGLPDGDTGWQAAGMDLRGVSGSVPSAAVPSVPSQKARRMTAAERAERAVAWHGGRARANERHVSAALAEFDRLGGEALEDDAPAVHPLAGASAPAPKLVTGEDIIRFTREARARAREMLVADAAEAELRVVAAKEEKKQALFTKLALTRAAPSDGSVLKDRLQGLLLVAKPTPAPGDAQVARAGTKRVRCSLPSANLTLADSSFCDSLPSVVKVSRPAHEQDEGGADADQKVEEESMGITVQGSHNRAVSSRPGNINMPMQLRPVLSGWGGEATQMSQVSSTSMSSLHNQLQQALPGRGDAAAPDNPARAATLGSTSASAAPALGLPVTNALFMKFIALQKPPVVPQQYKTGAPRPALSARDVHMNSDFQNDGMHAASSTSIPVQIGGGETGCSTVARTAVGSSAPASRPMGIQAQAQTAGHPWRAAVPIAGRAGPFSVQYGVPTAVPAPALVRVGERRAAAPGPMKQAKPHTGAGPVGQGTGTGVQRTLLSMFS